MTIACGYIVDDGIAKYVLQRPLDGYVTTGCADHDRQFRLAIEFAGQYFIVSNTFSGPTTLSDVLMKNSGSFPLVGEPTFSSLCSR